jgi:hypothetical protein
MAPAFLRAAVVVSTKSSASNLSGASGIPLFALDLCAAPKTGPVAEWLQAPHGTRSIGATYPKDSPYAMIFNQGEGDRESL